MKILTTDPRVAILVLTILLVAIVAFIITMAISYFNDNNKHNKKHLHVAETFVSKYLIDNDNAMPGMFTYDVSPRLFNGARNKKYSVFSIKVQYVKASGGVHSVKSVVHRVMVYKNTDNEWVGAFVNSNSGVYNHNA